MKNQFAYVVTAVLGLFVSGWGLFLMSYTASLTEEPFLMGYLGIIMNMSLLAIGMLSSALLTHVYQESSR